MRIITMICLLSISASMKGQTITKEDRYKGYIISDSTVTFVFDPQIYGVIPEKVVVTGIFRKWDANVNNQAWQLSPDGDIWKLEIVNSNFLIIKPNDKFKYLMDDGIWLQPPSLAPNSNNGDLTFEPMDELQALTAEIMDETTIWAMISGDRPLDVSAYRLTDSKGREIEIAAVLPNTSKETLIKSAEALDIRKVYFLEIPTFHLKSFCSFDGWFRHLYSPKELGATTKEDHTIIRLFAPRAELVKLYLYRERQGDAPYVTVDMIKDENEVWEAHLEENLHGIYYDFTVHGPDEPGNHFYETNPVHISDPYARVSDNTWGRTRIWNHTTPATPLKNGIPKMEDVIAYEVHVQDFTDQLPVEDKYKGTFNAMITPGLKNSRGRSIGFDYLLDLGINTVHLMPVQEYLHFPDDDWKASFANDPYMIEQGVSEENYQWGYRTTHAMAVESKYRVKGGQPGEERNQFRDLVQAFHDHGIAVIIDIVPNHTGENMDGNNWYFHFNAIDQQYYYRTKDFDHIGEYGNEIKTENRPMVQRWLIDQCLHYIHEFGIDGFRIDLAGQIDQQTLKALKNAIGHDKILYGEAWIGSNDPAYESNPDWDWYKEDSPITFFQDDSRNAFKGPVFELKDKYRDRGWPGGKYDERINVMKGLANKFPDDKTPLSGISYLDIHDNFALADQFATEGFDGRFEVDQDLYKIASLLLYTTVGPIVTHGGSEIMRSKGHAPLKEVVKVTKAGYKVFMHGKRDTYNHRTANQFIWENVGATPTGKNKNNYDNMHRFWKGLNAFRTSEIGKIFRKREPVSDHYYHWITPLDESLLGYIVDNQILVLINAGRKEYVFDSVYLTKGTWQMIGHNGEIDHVNGVTDSRNREVLLGGETLHIPVEAQQFGIWVKRAE